MNNLFHWDARKYTLGVREMDDEHMHLINRMNSLHKLHSTGAGASYVSTELEELLKFTVQHFTDEEAYMQRIDYPDRIKHAAIHRQLLACMSEFHQEFLRTGKLTEAFFTFLTIWLQAHICGVDMKYARHEHYVA